MTKPPISRKHRLPTVAACLALVLSWAAVSGARADDGEAASILDRYVEVTGGTDAYAAVENRVTTATLEAEDQSLTVVLTVTAARPRKMYALNDIPGFGTIEQGSDGGAVWEMNPMAGPLVYDDATSATILRANQIDADVRWRDEYPSVELGGMGEVEGKPCQKVVLTPKLGTPETRCYDQKTGLLLSTETTLSTPQGEVGMATFLSDYRAVDGIILPFSSRILSGGQERTMKVDSIRHNVAIDANRFAPPEEVLTLMAREKSDVAEEATGNGDQ